MKNNNMSHKNSNEVPMPSEGTLAAEQMECVVKYYHEHYKTLTFEECLQRYFDEDNERNTYGNFEKLSKDRIKLLKKGEKHVKTIP